MIPALLLAFSIVVLLLGLAVVGLFIQVQALRLAIGDHSAVTDPSDPENISAPGGRIARLSEIADLVRDRESATLYFTRGTCPNCEALVAGLVENDSVVCFPAADPVEVPAGLEAVSLPGPSFSALRLPGLPFMARFESGMLLHAGPVTQVDLSLKPQLP